MLFLFFLVIFNNFFIIPVDREKIKVQLALAIPTGALIIVANETIDTPPVVPLKIIINFFLCNQKQQCIYLILYCMIFFD